MCETDGMYCTIVTAIYFVTVHMHTSTTVEYA